MPSQVHVRRHFRRGYRVKGGTVRAHTRHLRSPAARRAFEARYGKARGDYVYGAVRGKVRRLQAANGTRAPRERIRAHLAHRGRTSYRVRGHLARVA